MLPNWALSASFHQTQKWLLKVASGRGTSTHLWAFHRVGRNLLPRVPHLPEVHAICTFSSFQLSLLPPAAEKKNYVFSMGSKQAALSS